DSEHVWVNEDAAEPLVIVIRTARNEQASGSRDGQAHFLRDFRQSAARLEILLREENMHPSLGLLPDVRWNPVPERKASPDHDSSPVVEALPTQPSASPRHLSGMPNRDRCRGHHHSENDPQSGHFDDAPVFHPTTNSSAPPKTRPPMKMPQNQPC